MRVAVALLVLVLSWIPLAASPPLASAAPCQFVLGFETLHDSIPDVVGSCLEDQHYNPMNGDGLQQTTRGLLVWRKADNFTAFTDGYRCWVNGPFGMQERLNSQRFSWEWNPDGLPGAPNSGPGGPMPTGPMPGGPMR